MPIKRIQARAVRLNGFTDGMVVPTGAFRESGVDLYPSGHSEKLGGTNKVTSYESDDTKIGQRHIPNEGNGLNNIIGPFTIEAFVIPDSGGVIVHKEGAFTLKVGEAHKAGPAVFDIHTRGQNGNESSERVSSEVNYPVVAGESWGTYTTGENKPHDLNAPNRQLLYVNAQFTGKFLRIYINTDLVAELDFGGEERLIRSGSSDVFIGGRGGEYRGIIESVRISRGIITPLMQPFTATADCVGLWDFDDEIDIPQIFFFSGKTPAQAQTGNDGVGDESATMPLPMVCVGYDFENVSVSSPITTPITLIAGYDYGSFKIRDYPNTISGSIANRPTGLEMLASYMLSIPIEDLKRQSWWNDGSGYLDVGTTVTKGRYHSDGLPISNLNAVVNAAGTDPLTGGSVTQFDYEATDLSPAGGVSLDPMVNPIERVRIVALDFNNNKVIVQNSLLQGTTADATSTGFLFNHPDNTPVWFTLGNGDLMVDPGNINRPKGQMTRARFTQNQRFSDKSGSGNDAYFISSHSRNSTEMLTQTAPAGLATSQEPPMASKLLLWLDSNDTTTLLRATGAAVTTNDQYVFHWKNKAYAGGQGQHYTFYGGYGDGWRWKQSCGNANGRSGLVAANPGETLKTKVAVPPQGGELRFPEGYPSGISAGTMASSFTENAIDPADPGNSDGWAKASMWVSGEGAVRIPSPTGGTAPKPFATLNTGGAGTVGGEDATNGQLSFYFMITPQYINASTITRLLHSEIFGNSLDFRIQNGAGNVELLQQGASATLSSSNKPAAGQPILVAIRTKVGGANTIHYNVYRQKAPAQTMGGNAGWTPAATTKFEPASNTTRDGIALFGATIDYHVSPGVNYHQPSAPPGFIVHEVLTYAHALTDAQEADVRQWFEDKYGVV